MEKRKMSPLRCQLSFVLPDFDMAFVKKLQTPHSLRQSGTSHFVSDHDQKWIRMRIN